MRCDRALAKKKHSSSAVDAGRSSQHPHGSEGTHPSGHCNQIPCVKATPTGIAGPRSSRVHIGDSTAQRGGRQDVREAQIAVQSFIMGASMRSAERARAAAPWACGGAAESHQQGARQGTLMRDIVQCAENRSNTCYMNASIISICWQMTMTNRDGAVPQAWQLQIRGRKWCPRNFLRLSLMTWRQPEAQHDAAEFLAHVLPRFSWYPTLFSWSVRYQFGDGLRREAHTAVHLLHLNAPDGLISSNLQDTINAWYQQHQLHALDSAPSMLLLQLPRFRQNGLDSTVNMVFRSTFAAPFTSPFSIMSTALNAAGESTSYKQH